LTYPTISFILGRWLGMAVAREELVGGTHPKKKIREELVGGTHPKKKKKKIRACGLWPVACGCAVLTVCSMRTTRDLIQVIGQITIHKFGQALVRSIPATNSTREPMTWALRPTLSHRFTAQD
jgi:hypothetical protein